MGNEITSQKKCSAFAEIQMDLEIVIQSELSQTEKHRYRVICCLCAESRKMAQMNSFTKQRQSHRHREQTRLPKGDGGGGGRVRRAGRLGLTCILLTLCIKQVTNENLLYSPGNSTQCSGVTRMERKPRKRGDICIYAFIQLTHFTAQQKY